MGLVCSSHALTVSRDRYMRSDVTDGTAQPLDWIDLPDSCSSCHRTYLPSDRLAWLEARLWGLSGSCFPKHCVALEPMDISARISENSTLPWERFSLAMNLTNKSWCPDEPQYWPQRGAWNSIRTERTPTMINNTSYSNLTLETYYGGCIWRPETISECPHTTMPIPTLISATTTNSALQILVNWAKQSTCEAVRNHKRCKTNHKSPQTLSLRHPSHPPTGDQHPRNGIFKTNNRNAHPTPTNGA